jgi:hypothetical protein
MTSQFLLEKIFGERKIVGKLKKTTSHRYAKFFESNFHAIEKLLTRNRFKIPLVY